MAVVPASHTFATTTATSSEANSFIRDPIAFLLNPPIAELRQTVAQTLTTGVGAPITFTTESVDTDPTGAGGHSTTVNTSRYAAVYAGWYQAGGLVNFAANATGRRLAWWAVNGTSLPATEVAMPATAAFSTGLLARSVQVYLNVGDYLELYGMQESGGNLSTVASAGVTASGMSVRWVSN